MVWRRCAVYGESRTRYVVGVVVVRKGPWVHVSKDPDLSLARENYLSSDLLRI